MQDVEDALHALVHMADDQRHEQNGRAGRSKLFWNFGITRNLLRGALRTFEKRLRDDVLATEVHYDSELPQDVHPAEGTIDGRRLTIGVKLSWESRLRAATDTNRSMHYCASTILYRRQIVSAI